MGAVYEAEDVSAQQERGPEDTSTEFADDSRARARFQREIEFAVKIEHPTSFRSIQLATSRPISTSRCG